MHVSFVTPAFSRFEVTRLALAQRAHLQGELAARGISASCVVVADDDNLDVASEFGFDGLWQDNEFLGRKFNDGIEWACNQGADYVCVVGSDDWVHADLFDRLPAAVAVRPDDAMVWHDGPEIVTGRQIALVDLVSGRLRHCVGPGQSGVIPWIIPRAALEPSGFRPVRETQQIGIDYSLMSGLRVRPHLVFADPHDVARVDFKSSVNLNSFDKITGAIGVGDPVDPWPLLEQYYPAALVERARYVSSSMAANV